MRSNNDPRLWFDKADGQILYGVFPDQRFYSSQYLPGNDAEGAAVRELVSLIAEYSVWCRVNYEEIRAGRPQVALPDNLLRLFAPAKVEEANETEVHADPDQG